MYIILQFTPNFYKEQMKRLLWYKEAFHGEQWGKVSASIIQNILLIWNPISDFSKTVSFKSKNTFRSFLAFLFFTLHALLAHVQVLTGQQSSVQYPFNSSNCAMEYQHSFTFVSCNELACSFTSREAHQYSRAGSAIFYVVRPQTWLTGHTLAPSQTPHISN